MRPLLLLLVILTAFSCGKKVDSNDLKDEVPYYQYYNVTFDKTANTMEAKANFRVREANGARVELTNGALIRLNDKPPTISMSDKTTYNWTMAGVPVADFRLVKNSGQTFTNIVTQEDAGDIIMGTVPATASKAAGFSVSWSGTDVDNTKETFEASVTKKGSPIHSFSKAVTGNQITFNAQELLVVDTGIVTIRLYRTRDLPVKQGDGAAGGQMTISTSAEKEIQLSK